MADNIADDQKQTPTEDQIKTANEAEMQRWEGDFKEEDLQVKYKREDDTDDKPKDNGNEESSDNSESEVQDEVASDEEVYSEPAPVVTVADPGQYQPADYSFDVTLADGKTVKISTPEEADKIAEDPENFKKPKELLDFITKTNSMRNKLDRDYDKWQEQKTLFDSQSQEEAQRQETVSNYAAEFDFLANKGLLPQIPTEFRDADWQDPEVAKDPVVKQYVAILDYMVKENQERAKAGVRPLNSILDAFNAYQLETGRTKADENKKQAGEARKAAGARVAGSTSSEGTPYVPKGIAVGRTNVFARDQSVWEN